MGERCDGRAMTTITAPFSPELVMCWQSPYEFPSTAYLPSLRAYATTYFIDAKPFQCPRLYLM